LTNYLSGGKKIGEFMVQPIMHEHIKVASWRIKAAKLKFNQTFIFYGSYIVTAQGQKI